MNPAGGVRLMVVLAFLPKLHISKYLSSGVAYLTLTPPHSPQLTSHNILLPRPVVGLELDWDLYPSR